MFYIAEDHIKKKKQKKNFLKQLLLGLGLWRVDAKERNRGKEPGFSLTPVKDAAPCSVLPASDWSHLDKKSAHKNNVPDGA